MSFDDSTGNMILKAEACDFCNQRITQGTSELTNKNEIYC